MAKQNVTFVERHVEKLVVGVAGAVLLGITATYLLSTPHKAPAGGEELGPASFYGAMAQQAETAQRRLANAAPAEPTDPLADLIPRTGGEPPPLQMAVVPVPPNPPLPEVSASGPGPFGQKIELVDVLPPTRPVITVGRSSGRFPDPIAIPIRAGQQSQSARGQELNPLLSDKQWVTLAATISRKDQLEAFAEAGYLPGRLELVVADVLVERQERLSNGQWAQPQRVQPYTPFRYVIQRATIDLISEAAGYAVSAEDAQNITAVRSAFESRDVQDQVLRPPFQEFIAAGEGIACDVFQWSVPRALPTSDGSLLDLEARATQLGILFPAAAGADARPGTSGSLATTIEGGTKGARDALRQAQQAIETGAFLEAERLLDLLLSQKDLPALVRRPAEQLLQQHQQGFDRARRQEAELAERPDREEGVSKLGPDVEPLWVNDTSVEPGKCYRYRLALQAVNPYAGVAASLKNPRDAARLVVQGQWSEWSDAVIAPPDKYLFAISVKPTSSTARLEMHQWIAGNWEKATAEFRVGDVVEFPQRYGPPLSYGAVVYNVDATRRALKPQRRDKAYEPAETGAVLLVDAQGEIEEHLIVADDETRTAVKNMVQEHIRKARERAESAKTSGTPAGRRTPLATPPPSRGVGGS